VDEGPRPIPRWIDVAIALSWAWLLVEAWFEGQEIPGLLAELPVFPALSWPIVVGLIAVAPVAGGSAFLERKRLSDEVPVVTRLVDRWLGAGPYRALNDRMRPVLLSVLGTAVLAVSTAAATRAASGEPRGLLIAAGAAAAAIGLTTALLLSRRYPPTLK
jgi:hypothetical protein